MKKNKSFAKVQVDFSVRQQRFCVLTGLFNTMWGSPTAHLSQGQNCSSGSEYGIS